MSRAARKFGMRLEVRDIRVERGGRRVLDGLSFALAPGEALIVTGPNGAGKSTLLRVLAGLLPLKQGRIAIGGAEDPPPCAELAHYVGHGGGEPVVLGGDAEIAAGQGNELAAGGSACRFCAGARERPSRRGFIGRPETPRGVGAAARRAAADLAARRAAERAG